MPLQRYSLEIGLDSRIRKRIQHARNFLRDKGMVSEFEVVGYIPRITVLVTDDGDQLLSEFHRCLSLARSIPICFDSLEVFEGQNNTISLIPVASEELITLHSKLCHVLSRGFPHRGIRVKDKFKPDVWTPQCVVAKGITQHDFDNADISLSTLLDLPISGTVESIHVVDLSDHRSELNAHYF